MVFGGVVGGAVTRLSEEYRSRGLAETMATFESMRDADSRLRLATDALERVVPVRRFAAELLYYGDVVEREGLGRGSRQALERWGLRPRVEIDGAAWQVLADDAFVAFGNHPAGIEIAFFNALLDREDVYFLAGPHVGRVAPRLAHKLILVTSSAPRASTQRTRRVPRRFCHGVGGALRAPVDDADARAHNSAALMRCAHLVGQHGAGVHLFPAGSMHPDARWQHGVGRIVDALRRMESDVTSSVFLIPVVYDVSPIHIMASGLFPPASPLRRLAQLRMWTWRGPPSMFIPRPIRLSELSPASCRSPGALTDALHALWRSTAAQARDAFERWTPFGTMGPRRASGS